MSKSKSSNLDRVDRPDPDDLMAFLPWACAQLQLSKDVAVSKTVQSDYISTVASERVKTKARQSKSRLPSVVDITNNREASLTVSQDTRNTDTVRINAIVDVVDHVIGLKFDRNSSIPRNLMKILGLIIKFQAHLTILIINQALNKYVLYEIVNFLPHSRITDICLDDCFLREGSYFTLLENVSNIRNLSLARCRINDHVVDLIASELHHPKPGSNLIVLNLSSNRITDAGARSIRDALKMNNKLEYLNLADNMITDDGAASIFNILMEYPVTENELIAMRGRHINYLREQHSIATQTTKDMLTPDMPKAAGKKSARSAKPKGKEGVSERTIFYSDDKGQMGAENEFKDPYRAENLTRRLGVTYCLGNNTLAVLNLSYNNLTFPSVPKLLELVSYQKEMDRKPRGLLCCRIEGNLLPICKELDQIEELFDSGLSGPKRNAQIGKKKGK